MNPGIYWYTVSVVYDLSGFGFPGEEGESMEAGPVCVTCAWGYHLPFYEDWSSGSFDENNWSADAQNWEINGQQGLDPPCASFSWDPVLSNYKIGLESFFLDATDTTEGEIFVDFDLKLISNDTSGTETMQLQVWNWENGMYTTIRTFENDTGSFDWQHFHVNIGILALDMLFKIRFLAKGDNTSHIQAWFIDNIEIYRECPPPENLQVSIDFIIESMVLDWDLPYGHPQDEWLHWDDGVNFAGIGLGGPIEFDVAARWTPDQLVEYDEASLTKVAFYPDEAQAIYRIRIWTGAGPANLVLDQEVVNPTIGIYDTINLDNPLPLDVSKELWVGYYINTPKGYPAGCDDGPTIDGYGNMMNYEGGWQTLIQINSELDYNWNIQAFLTGDGKDIVIR